MPKHSVTAALGKLLRTRFKADVLRGRWDNQTFALGIPSDQSKDIMDALQFITKEVEQMQFVGDLGKRFDISITTGVATYPNDCNTADSLVDAAKNRLLVNLRQKTGVTFFT